MIDFRILALMAVAVGCGQEPQGSETKSTRGLIGQTPTLSHVELAEAYAAQYPNYSFEVSDAYKELLFNSRAPAEDFIYSVTIRPEGAKQSDAFLSCYVVEGETTQFTNETMYTIRHWDVKFTGCALKQASKGFFGSFDKTLQEGSYPSDFAGFRDLGEMPLKHQG